MRVLFHTYDLAFQRMGGGERVMLALAQALRVRGTQVDFYDPWIHDPASFSLVHYFSSKQTEYWHYHRRQFPALPLVVTPTIHPETGMVRRLVQSWKLRRAFSQPHHFFPTTLQEANFLQGRLNVNPRFISVLPNGIEPYIYHGDAQIFWHRIGESKKTPVVLCVGRFQPVKNQLNLVKALGLIDNISCVFIGDEDRDAPGYLQECRSVAESIMQTRRGLKIMFWPGLSHHDPLLAAAFAACNVYVMPSRFETFGIAGLEAAAAGCEIVCTKNLGDRTLFKDFASFIDPNNPAEISVAIQGALKREKKLDIRKELADRFSWDQIAKNLIRVYEETKNAMDPSS